MMRRYLALHVQNLLGGLGRLVRQPVATLMTTLVLAVALALPAGLRVLVANADTLSSSWESVSDFSVYLDLDVSLEAAAAIANMLDQRPDTTQVVLITRDDALEEFRRGSGFADALDALDTNPLPHTLVVRPASTVPADIAGLAAAIETLEGVDNVQVDTAWVARLRAIIDLAARTIDILTVLLAAGVVIVIGNTIRLEVNNRREEIIVMKLVGGSDAFIRRPFLYLGFWYGLGGALGATVLITVTLLLLGGPVAQLTLLYGSDFRLDGLGFRDFTALLGAGALLGWLGAALSTSRQLRAIEPA